MITSMSYFSDKFTEHLASLGLKPYDIWKYFKDKPESERLSENYIYKFCRGERIKKVEVLEKLSTVESLNLSLPTLKAWWIIDSATPEEKEALLRELQPDRVKCLASQIKEEKEKKRKAQ